MTGLPHHANLTAVSLVALLAGFACPAAAHSPAECAVAPDPDYVPLPDEVVLTDILGPAVNLGEGWVLQQYEVSGSAGTQLGAQVVDCASGTGAIVVEGTRGQGEAVSPITRLSAQDAFAAAIASDQVMSIDDVLAQLTAAGANSGPDRLQSPAAEACGCAVFYPALRGAKSPWTDWGTQ